MSSSVNPCETITLFTVSPEYLSSNQDENRKLCGICLEDFKVGDHAACNGCCQALACLVCLSRSVNMRMPESRGGGLPAWAKCQLCGELFDREPLNNRIPPILAENEETTMQGFEMPIGGERLHVWRLVTSTANADSAALADESDVDEVAEEIEYDDGYIKVTKIDGGWIYAVGTVDTFIDEGFMQDGDAKLDLAGAMAWGRVMTKDLPKERKITQEEALQGLSEYTFYEWVSDSADDNEEAMFRRWLGLG